MKRIINPNYSQLRSSYKSGKRGCVLEGSSRSGKTWSCIDNIIKLCASEKEPFTLNIIKETYNSFKTTLYEDFDKRLPMFGLPSPFRDVQEKPTFKLLGNKINLIGADKPSKFLGAGSDFIYFNEANHIPRSIFDQAEMRCSKFWFMDYNPEHTDHWIYDNVITRPDVDFLRTTFLDNPFVPEQQKLKILSYEPTEENIKNGTADEWMWKVYGLGQRAPRKGLVFKYWQLYDELPVNDYEFYRYYGIDWGGNDPTTLIEININSRYKLMYIKELLYRPDILNSDLIKLILKENPGNHEVICDSARKDKIVELQSSGINAIGATKGEGSIIDGIDKMKEFNIFIHKDSSNAINEFGSYRWSIDKTTDKTLNMPIDKDNHIIDPCRYVTRYHVKNYGL